MRKTQTITGTLESINSRRDTNGNCYWALRYTDHASGKTVCGTVSGGESNIHAILLHWNNRKGWDRSIRCEARELPIREFDRLVKDWPYAGCSPEELAQFIRKYLND